MPETRYMRNFDKDGNELESTSYEISDEQVYFEKISQECNEQHTQMLKAYRNYDSLTAAQKDQLLKALLRAYLDQNKGWFLANL